MREGVKTRLYQPVSPHVHKDFWLLSLGVTVFCSVTVRMRELLSWQKTKNLYDQCCIQENWCYIYIQHGTGFPVWFSVSCRALKITHLFITVLTINHVVCT